MADTQINVGMNVDGVITGTEKAKRSLKDLGGAASEAGKAAGKVGDGTDAAAAKIERDTRRISNEFKRLQVAAETAGKSLSESMVIKANAYSVPLASIQAQIDGAKAFEKAQLASNQALLSGSSSLQKVGMSAAATSAALRNVPAQFTDIVTSLQGGQKPMTVLLQQGGQLKDMFGGAGNAAKALGGYVMGLINPYTIAAAAAGGLFLAYNKGAAEGEAYNKALIMTGNSAGTTAVQLSNMAQAVSKATGGTVGAAADALAQLAGSSNIASSQFERVAATAVAMEKATGVAVAETVKQFSELGKDPLAASIKLNDSTRFLTMSVYEQIKALTEQGRTVEAGVVAQKAYADVMDQRTPKLIENLGYIESAWKAVGSATSGAISWMAGIGRDADPLIAYRKRLDELTDPAKNHGIYGDDPRVKAEIEALKQKLGYAQETDRMMKRTAESQATAAASIKSQIEFDKEHDKYLSKSVQMNSEIAAAGEKYASVAQTPANLAKYVESIKGIQDKFKDAATPKISKESISEATKGLNLYNDLMATSVKVSANYTEEQAKLNAGLKGGTLSMEQYDAATRALIAKQPYMIANIKDEADAVKAATKAYQESEKEHARYIDGLGKGLDKLTADTNAQQARNDRLGLSKEAIADLDAAELQLQATKLDGLAIDELVMRHDTAAYELQKASAQQLRDKAAAMQSGAAKETSLDYAKDQLNEWKKSVQKYDDIFSKGFADMLNGGEGAWKSFTKSLTTTFKTSVADQIYKMFAQPFVMRIVASLIGVSGSGASGLAQAAGMGSNGTGLINGLSAAQNLKSAYDALTTGFSTSFASYVGNLTTSVLGQTAGNAAIGGALTGDITSSALAAQVSGQAAANLAGQAAYTQALTAGATEAAAQTAATQATTAALQANSSTLANTGAGIGTAATAAAGIAIGTLIAGNKELFGAGGLAWSAIGAAVGTWVFPVVGTFAGAVVGGILDAAFGQGPTEMDSSGVRGTLANTGFSGNAYANMSQDAGWFNDGDNWTELRAVPGEISSALDTAFAATKISIAKLAISLGQSTDKIAGYTKYIDIAAGTSNEAINAMFIGMGNEMAAQILSNKTGQVGAFDAAYYMAQNPDVAASSTYGGGGWLGGTLGNGAARHFNDWGRAEGRAQNAQSMVSTGKDYTYLQRNVTDEKTGVTAMETATQTLTRLSESLQGANVWLKVLDHALLSVSLDGAEAASKLSDAFGGLDKMAAANKSYYDMFWSDSEKLADTTENVAKGLALVGVAMPTSKDAFRNIVSGLDLMTDAGRSAYAVMLNLAPEFAQVADAASAAAKATADAAKEQAAQAREQAIANAAQAREQATAAAVQTIANAQLIIPADALRGAFDQADILRLFGINSSGVQDTAAQEKLNIGMSAGDITNATDESLKKYQSLNEILAGNGAHETIVKYINTYSEDIVYGFSKLFGTVSAFALQSQDVKNTFTEIQSYATKLPFSWRESNLPVAKAYRDNIATAESAGLAPSGTNANFALLAAQKTASKYMTDRPPEGIGKVLAVNSEIDFLNESTGLYKTALRELGQQLLSGAKSQEQYATSLKFAADMTIKAGGALDQESYTTMAKSLQQDKQLAGISSVTYYLDDLAKTAALLGTASKAASEPISVLAETVGRLKSAAFVFGESAAAIGGNIAGQANKAIAQAIADVSKDAAGWLNTQTGQAVKDQFADNPIFNGVDFQKIGPMLDSVGAWNIAGYEQAFTRLSNALGQGEINVEQYTGIMGYAKDMFLDTANTLSEAAVAASELSRLLTGALDSMQSQIAATYTDRQAAQAQIEAAIAIAGAGGPLPKADDVKDAVSLLTKNASSMFSTYEDYKRDYNRATINMSTLNNLATNKQSKTTDDVVAELVAVKLELQAVKAELIGVRAETQSTAISSHKTAKTLTRVTQDGESITTSAIA